MNSNDYDTWLETNCPNGVSRNNFVNLLIVVSIKLLDESSKSTGRNIPDLIYETSVHYKEILYSQSS